MDKYPELTKLRGQILGCNASLREIATQAGVAYDTVRIIALGDAENTSLKTLYKIRAAIKALKAAK